MPVGAVVWPVRILSNPILPYQFIPKPGQMQVDAGIRTVALAGVRGQFNPTFDQALEGLSPEHHTQVYDAENAQTGRTS